jgi:hypothetical protein
MTRENNCLWILQRDPSAREALLRLVPPGLEIVTGSPGETRFANDELPAPGAVVLGVTGDFELELDFVHRMRDQISPHSWILIASPRDLDEAKRLFDTITGEVLAWLPPAGVMHQRIQVALGRRGAPALSQRNERETLAARFARWFPETELPGLLRALDPSLWGVPVLLQGEPGSGRSLVARYIHTFTRHQPADFMAISCAGAAHPNDLLAQIAGPERERSHASVFLEDPQRLSPDLQHRICDWIEFGLPQEAGTRLSADHLRWIVAVGPASETVLLTPRLAQALAGLVLSLEPLRGRRDAIAHFTTQALRVWSEAHGGAAHRLSPEAMELLYAYPWPGNYRELDAVLTRSLTRAGARELHGRDLQFDPDFAPSRSEHETPLHGSSPLEDDFITPTAVPGDKPWPRILHAAAEELENPLASIRTLAELMPEYHGDSEFRDQFQQIVDADLGSIERILRDVRGIADLSRPKIEPIDAASLIDALIEAQLPVIESRRIHVRKELDRDYPMALGDPQLLEHALAGIFRRSIEALSTGGSLFATSRSHADLQGNPTQLRILLRCEEGPRSHETETELQAQRSPETSLEFVVAHAILHAMGGSLTLDAGNGRETVVIIDLPAPAFA